MLAPGRTASGEAFAYAQLDFGTELIVADRLAVRECYSLGHRSEGLDSLRQRFPTAYYASVFVVSPRSTGDPLRKEIATLNQTGVMAGASHPVEGVCVIKILAADSLSLRQAASKLRRIVYAHLGRPEPFLRKL
jgi:urease accessory protein